MLLKNKNIKSDLKISILIFMFLIFLIVFADNMDDFLAIIIDLNSVMISVWATLLGFLITSVSVLLTIKDSKYILALKKSGHFKQILEIFVTTCFAMAILLISSIVLFIQFNLLFLYVYIFFSILGFVRLFSCLRILLKIIALIE